MNSEYAQSAKTVLTIANSISPMRPAMPFGRAKPGRVHLGPALSILLGKFESAAQGFNRHLDHFAEAPTAFDDARPCTCGSSLHIFLDRIAVTVHSLRAGITCDVALHHTVVMSKADVQRSRCASSVCGNSAVPSIGDIAPHSTHLAVFNIIGASTAAGGTAAALRAMSRHAFAGVATSGE
jgi:hypothetical protein